MKKNYRTKTTKMLRNSAIMLLLVSITGCTPQKRQEPLKGTVDLQGHRGARGLRPENSIPAFIYCIEKGMSTVELDTNLTADKKLIVYHDVVLNKKLCRDSRGRPARPLPIMDLTIKQLKTYDCGSVKHNNFPRQQPQKGLQMPTLEEFFAFIKKHEKQAPAAKKVRFNIEIKFPDQYPSRYLTDSAAEILRVLKKEGMSSRTTVQSFVPEVLPLVKKKDSAVMTSALFKPTYWKGFKMMIGLDADRDAIIQKARKVGADIISPYHLYVTPAFVRKCHRHNLQVIPWTVNSRKKMIKLFNAGVDGIISDYPCRLKKVYDQWKQKNSEIK